MHRDSLGLFMSFWYLWFVGLMWLLNWWLTWVGWRLWCIISICSLGVRLEVDGWVRGICNFAFIMDIQFWWYSCVFLFFIFVLLFLLKLAYKGEHERTCFHTSLILVAHSVLIRLQYQTSDLSSISHICFFKINCLC